MRNKYKTSDYMQNHPDNVSPSYILQKYKERIDNYIGRLGRAGSQNTAFCKFYKSKSREFEDAINCLNGSPRKTTALCNPEKDV